MLHIRIQLLLCCLMTSDSRKGIRCHVWPYRCSFLCLQITRADIRPQLSWVVSLVITDGHFLSARYYYATFIKFYCQLLTLKVLNFWKFASYCSLKPLWLGMGEAVPARTSLDPTFSIPSHCASIITTSTLKVNIQCQYKYNGAAWRCLWYWQSTWMVLVLLLWVVISLPLVTLL